MRYFLNMIITHSVIKKLFNFSLPIFIYIILMMTVLLIWEQVKL